jgi:hypothetical protein
MIRTPANLDRRSLELHRLIAHRVQSDPSALRRAAKNILRWRSIDPRGCPGWDEWERILDAGLAAAVEAMLDPGERGQYLRSCTPFTRVLSPRERAEFLKSWSASK